MMELRLGMCIGLVLVFVCGCGTPVAPPVASDDLAAASVEPAPADAAATVTAFAKAVRDGKVEAAYDLLPTSYQKDIDGVVHDFATRMDSEVWETGFNTLGKAAEVLNTKKELLLSMVPQQQGREADVEKLKTNWDALAGGLAQLAASDLSRIQKLESTPARELLRQGIGPLLKTLATIATVRTQDGATSFADLDQVKAEIVTSTESTASVKITSPHKPEPETVDFAKVDGKWIPKSMADDWATNMEKVREQVQDLDVDTLALNKPQILKVFKTVDGVLEQMKTAETAEEIQGASFALLPVAMMMANMQNQMGVANTKSKPANHVTIIVTQELSEGDQSKLNDFLKPLVDDTEALSTTSSLTNGKTVVMVKPVANVAEFAEKLTIAKEVEIDEQTRIINVGRIEFE